MKDGGKPLGPDETLDAPGYKPPKKGRFTLVGFMVGVLVVGFLGTIVISSAIQTAEKARWVKTGHLVSDVKLACENFRLEYGQYPWAKPSAADAATIIDGKDVYAELRGLPGAKVNTTQDYLGEVQQRFLKNGVLVDYWGREILFRVNPNGLQAVIWSCGLNGVDETNDGTSPAPAKFPKGYYWFGKGDTGDDITSM
jgi:type II secretory pathway pseudopilin PulG